MATDLQIYIDFDPHENGLLVGLACRKLGPGEFIGVIIFNDDAQHTLFHLRLDTQAEPESFLATASDDPWAGWAYNFANIQPDLQPPIAMDAALGSALEALVQQFTADWFWVDTDPDADALAAQYDGLGFEVFHINVRPDKLAEMAYQEDAEEPGTSWLVFDTVADAILKEVLEEYILSPMS